MTLLAPTQTPPPTADGWRLRLDRDESGVRSLSAALGAVLAERFAGPKVVVGCDGRACGRRLATESARLLAGRGCKVALAGLLPTPVATDAVRHGGYDAAVLVTASHNPAGWTGVKLKLAPGGPPDRDLELSVNRRASSSPPPAGGAAPAPLPSVGEELLRSYAERVLGYVDRAPIRERAPLVVVDGLNGVGGALLRDLLLASGCHVIAAGVEPAPDFGGVAPNPMLPEARSRAGEAVRSSNAVAGFVLDGDADRLGVIDERGEFVPPHDVFSLLLPVAAATAPPPAAVATTVETGSIVGCVAAELGRRMIETPVGFKHISPAMREGRVFAGAGAVGDLGFRHHSFDRDALLAALMLAQLLSERRAPLSRLVADLRRRYGSTSYFNRSFAIRPGAAPDLLTLGHTALSAASLDRDPIAISEVDGVKLVLGARDFLSLRRGTTEPLLRVSLELSKTGRAAEAILESIRLQLDA